MIHRIKNRQPHTTQKYCMTFCIEIASFETTSLFDDLTFQTKIKFLRSG